MNSKVVCVSAEKAATKVFTIKDYWTVKERSKCESVHKYFLVQYRKCTWEELEFLIYQLP